MPAPNPIEAGTVFGQLTVLRPSKRELHYVCRCSCGTVKDVRKDHLRGGKIVSCGCYKDRAASKRAKAGVMSKANVTHGASRSRAYTAWLSMRQRCNNPNAFAYSDYGGRGIRICKRWDDFANFLADMGQPGKSRTLERIDNNRGYDPENCRWASRREQQNNRRVNRLVKFRGTTRTVAEWSRLTGIHHNTISQRLDKGLPVTVVLSPERVAGPSKLTPDDVRAIRRVTDIPGSVLARGYGVSPANIVAIRQRRSWADLPD